VSAPSPAEQTLARAVVEKMLSVDGFSRWLGIEVLEISPGRSVLRMTVRDEMINGFGTAHGGIAYSLADSALAFATNTGGFISVAMDCTISYPAAVRSGDTLTATAIEESTTNKLAFCAVTVRRQDEVIVAHFRGTVYRTPKQHFPAGLP
jgi:acyl-CoA thioesterase